MTNTSATGGYLSPSTTLAPPTEDADFEDQIQKLVVGITGLDGTLVRPRWQATTPHQPERDISWCAIGVVAEDPDDNAYISHHSTNDIDDPDAYDEMQRHEVVSLLASFYGPVGRSYAKRFRDGLSIAQNREALTLAGMGFVDVGNVTNLSEIINQQTLRRADVTLRVRRQVIRNYPVLNIRAVNGAIVSDTRPDFTPDEYDAEFGGSGRSEPFHVEP